MSATMTATTGTPRQCLVAPNKSVETNRSPASPSNARRQLESVSCAPPSLSAAVADLSR